MNQSSRVFAFRPIGGSDFEKAGIGIDSLSSRLVMIGDGLGINSESKFVCFFVADLYAAMV